MQNYGKRGPARVAQRPHERGSGARGEALWALGSIRSPAEPSGPVFEAPALVAGFENIAVVSQPIEQRGGHFGVPDAFMTPPFSIAWCVAGEHGVEQSAPRRDRFARVVLLPAAVRSAARAPDSQRRSVA